MKNPKRARLADLNRTSRKVRTANATRAKRRSVALKNCKAVRVALGLLVGQLQNLTDGPKGKMDLFIGRKLAKKAAALDASALRFEPSIVPLGVLESLETGLDDAFGALLDSLEEICNDATAEIESLEESIREEP